MDDSSPGSAPIPRPISRKRSKSVTWDDIASTASSSSRSSSAKRQRRTNSSAEREFNFQFAADEFEHWDVPERYELVKVLGKGSYGEVAEAYDRITKRKVAIKRMPDVLSDETDAIRMFREIFILRRLKHKHVINLVDILKPPKELKDFKDVYMVFEFLDTDLYKLLQSEQYLTDEHVQSFLYQLLCGLKHIHAANCIHRDLKPANILLNEDCTLKICDFGLSRVMPKKKSSSSSSKSSLLPKSPMPSKKTSTSSTRAIAGRPQRLNRSMTKHVVTRWYRCPELILLQNYDTAVDVWSAGCIFAELLSMQKKNVSDYRKRRALFPGKSCFPLTGRGSSPFNDSYDQLNVIFDVIGTPNKADYAGFENVGGYLEKLEKKPRKDLKKTMWPGCDDRAIDLLQRMLTFNPRRRISVDDALKHPFLKSYADKCSRLEDRAEKEIPTIDDFPDLPRNISSDALKAIVHREMMDYCKQKEKGEKKS